MTRMKTSDVFFRVSFWNKLLVLLLVFASLAAGAMETPQSPPGAALDGVKVESLETYLNPKNTQLDLGLGVWPLNPYYNGFSVEGGYSRYFSKTYSWEVLHGSYIYTVDSDLTSQLAQSFAKNPVQIERLRMVVSSNLQMVMAYGKFIFNSEYIRYFRSSLLAGPAYVDTNLNGTFGVNIGWRFDVISSGNFSWRLDIRDLYAFSIANNNNLTFALGTAYGF